MKSSTCISARVRPEHHKLQCETQANYDIRGSTLP